MVPGADVIGGGLSAPDGFLGEVRWSACLVTDARWKLCDGSAISRTTYAALFAKLNAEGLAFGVGDGTTTFNLPNLGSSSPMGTGQGSGLTLRAIGDSGGSENVVLGIDQLPSHSHPVVDPGHGHNVTDPGHVHTLEQGTGAASGDDNIPPNTSGLGDPMGDIGAGAYRPRAKSATTGISVASGTTGITTSTTGASSASSNLHPYLCLHAYIRVLP